MKPSLAAEESPIRVVFDTNVTLALMVFQDPGIAALRELWDDERLTALVDDDTLAELDRVLRYPQLRLPESRALDIAARYRERSVLIPNDDRGMSTRLPRCRDPDDQKFLTLAKAGDALALLTRDKALLEMRKRVPFVVTTPERFIPFPPAPKPEVRDEGLG